MSASKAAFSFVVISEAGSDLRIARGLAERLLVEEIDWLESESLPELCHWQGAESNTSYLSWSGIERAAKRAGIVIHGRYAGAFDERRSRLALLLSNALEKPPAAVFFVRDTDNIAERVPSLERARAAPWPFAVILATPHTKRECWILNGFEPANSAEQSTLERAQQKLGFHPCVDAERLLNFTPGS